jgi:hypothetical protein
MGQTALVLRHEEQAQDAFNLAAATVVPCVGETVGGECRFAGADVYRTWRFGIGISPFGLLV